MRIAINPIVSTFLATCDVSRELTDGDRDDLPPPSLVRRRYAITDNCREAIAPRLGRQSAANMPVKSEAGEKLREPTGECLCRELATLPRGLPFDPGSRRP